MLLLADFSFAIATYTSFDLPSIKDGREYKRNGIIADIKAGERIPVLTVGEWLLLVGIIFETLMKDPHMSLSCIRLQ